MRNSILSLLLFAGHCFGQSAFDGDGCLLPIISVQPVSLTVVTNTTTNFTVTASRAVSYQWKTNGVNLTDNSQYFGSLTSTLWVSNVTMLQSNLPFAVGITNGCGGVLSSAATLTVTNGASGGNGLLAGLVSAWEMEAASGADQPDATASGKTLTHVGSTTQSATHIQGSFSVQGGGSIFLDSSDAAFDNTSSFSIATWLNRNGNTITAQAPLDRSGVGTAAWTVVMNASPFTATYYIRNAANTTWFTATSANSLNSAGYHLMVITYDSSSKVGKISIDGENFVATPTTDGMNTSASHLQIGAISGLTDETAYWSVPITQAQVTALWASGAGFFYNNNGGNWN